MTINTVFNLKIYNSVKKTGQPLFNKNIIGSDNISSQLGISKAMLYKNIKNNFKNYIYEITIIDHVDIPKNLKNK